MLDGDYVKSPSKEFILGLFCRYLPTLEPLAVVVPTLPALINLDRRKWRKDLHSFGEGRSPDVTPAI